jgi:hypothetical protein
MDDGEDVKAQSLRLEEVLEENRDLRHRMEAMEAMMQRFLPPAATPISTGPTATTPVSRSSIPHVPTIEPRRPPSSAVRSLSFRPPPPAPIAPSNPTTFLKGVEVDQSSPPPSKPRSRNLRVHVPDKFGGSTQERATADLWLQSVVFWMRLTAEGESDDALIMMFGNVLKGTALKWFSNFRIRAERERRQLTLQDVFDGFVRTYEGGLAQKMAEQKLNALVYGKGECKDLTATENEFDRLAQELYPGAEESDAAISLLARIYSDIIRKGDEELWEKAMDAQPSTLDEWKAAVQNAYTVIETKKAHHRSARADRQDVRTNYYSRSSSSPSTSSSAYRNDNAVQAKKVGVEEDSHDRQVGEESENKEELQKAEVSSASRPASRPTSERLGTHLTFKQRSRLAELNKCWICLEKGHRSFECEKKGKAGYPRKPTAEDLKA